MLWEIGMIATKDMTKGSPWKLILGFSLPLMLGNVFQQLYTFIDTLVVGRALGANALAALGATEWLTFMMFGFIAGLTQGFSIVMAKCFGKRDYTGLRRSVSNSCYLAVLCTIIFTVVGQVAVYPILKIMHTPTEIIDMSVRYLRILYAGVPIAMAYNLLAAMLRALGNSKAPLRAMTISSICNIVLDVIFVFVFRWGIAGAAYATLISELFATAYCIVRLRGIEVLKFEKGERLLNIKLCRQELCLALPMGLQNTITASGGLIVQSVINGFGVLFIAGFTAANKLYGLLEIAASSYGYAMHSYTGQNSGARLHARVRKGLRVAVVIGGITAYMMSAIMMVFGKWILGCFITKVPPDSIASAVSIGYEFLTVLAIFFPLLYILYIVRACLQGLGNTVVPMVSSIAQLVMRSGCAVLLTAVIGYKALFYGEVFAWVGALILLSLSLAKTTVNVGTSDVI